MSLLNTRSKRILLAVSALAFSAQGQQASISNASNAAAVSPYARYTNGYSSFDNPYAPGGLYDPYKAGRATTQRSMGTPTTGTQLNSNSTTSSTSPTAGTNFGPANGVGNGSEVASSTSEPQDQVDSSSSNQANNGEQSESDVNSWLHSGAGNSRSQSNSDMRTSMESYDARCNDINLTLAGLSGAGASGTGPKTVVEKLGSTGGLLAPGFPGSNTADAISSAINQSPLNHPIPTSYGAATSCTNSQALSGNFSLGGSLPGNSMRQSIHMSSSVRARSRASSSTTSSSTTSMPH